MNALAFILELPDWFIEGGKIVGIILLVLFAAVGGVMLWMFRNWRLFCLLPSALCLCLSSCGFYQHTATSANGNTERDMYAFFGGTASHKGADGSSFVHDHQASFQQAMQTAGTFGAGYLAAGVSKAMETTKQLKDTNATNLAVTNSNNAAAAAEAAAKADAQTKLLLANPGAVKPAATTLNAP